MGKVSTKRRGQNKTKRIRSKQLKAKRPIAKSKKASNKRSKQSRKVKRNALVIPGFYKSATPRLSLLPPSLSSYSISNEYPVAPPPSLSSYSISKDEYGYPATPQNSLNVPDYPETPHNTPDSAYDSELYDSIASSDNVTSGKEENSSIRSPVSPYDWELSPSTPSPRSRFLSENRTRPTLTRMTTL